MTDSRESSIIDVIQPATAESAELESAIVEFREPSASLKTAVAESSKTEGTDPESAKSDVSDSTSSMTVNAESSRTEATEVETVKTNVTESSTSVIADIAESVKTEAANPTKTESTESAKAATDEMAKTEPTTRDVENNVVESNKKSSTSITVERFDIEKKHHKTLLTQIFDIIDEGRVKKAIIKHK